MTTPSRTRTLALVASAASLLLVGTVAAAPGSPFTPVLPPGAQAGGPFRWLAELAGLDAVHGNALAAVGVVAVTFAAAAFALVLRECRAGTVRPRTVLGLAIAAHVALLVLPLLFSRDVYSYSFYGRIAATYHANPYVATPADFPQDALADFVGPRWVDTPAVYGPVWTQASGLVVRLFGSIEGSIVAFRTIAIAASLATLWVISSLVRRERPDLEAFALAMWGLNPVVLFQSVASGHNDVLVALSIASALALVFARRELLATGVLALGTLVKATAAVPLLLFVVAVVVARPRGARGRALAAHVAVAGGIGLVAAAPFLNTSDPTLGMAELSSHEGWLAPSRFFRRLFDALSGDTLGFVPRVVLPVVLVGVLILIARELVRRAPALPRLQGSAWGWGLLCLTLLGPVLLPWYVTWTLPLAWVLPRVPRIVLIGTSLALTLSQWTTEPARFDAAYDGNLLFGHYVVTPVVIALTIWLLVDLRRRIRDRQPLEDAPDQVPTAAGDR